MLYFYPKDNTPGCTRQACAFAGAYEAFKMLNAAAIAKVKPDAGAAGILACLREKA